MQLIEEPAGARIAGDGIDQPQVGGIAGANPFGHQSRLCQIASQPREQQVGSRPLRHGQTQFDRTRLAAAPPRHARCSHRLAVGKIHIGPAFANAARIVFHTRGDNPAGCRPAAKAQRRDQSVAIDCHGNGFAVGSFRQEAIIMRHGQAEQSRHRIELDGTARQAGGIDQRKMFDPPAQYGVHLPAIVAFNRGLSRQRAQLQRADAPLPVWIDRQAKRFSFAHGQIGNGLVALQQHRTGSATALLQAEFGLGQ